MPHANPVPASTQSNIAAIANLEQEFLESRRFADKLSDAIARFVGSISFVALHLAWFAGWILLNFRLVPFVPAFDPYPYQLLCMLVSLEGVLLSTFVLIKQNRMSLRADQRSHLDLQINLLSEKEITKLLQMQTLICRQLGIAEPEHDPEVNELSKATAVDNLAKELEKNLPDNA